MTAADLLDSLEALADAPGGIDHLRELVLHLAVRGRLVPQDPAEEPSCALLERITEERRQLVEDGSLRKQKPQAPVQSQETPFELPESWAWARLGHYCALEMGQSPPSEFYNQDGEGLPFFQGKADFGDLNPTPRYWCTRPTKYADGKDVLLSVRAPVGPTNVATEECCIGRGIAGLRPLSGTPTMMLLWTMRAFESDLCALGTGTTFVAISKKNLEPFVLPVPPLEEQHRIVARVDELMALLDRLEAAKDARDATRAQLRDAALAALQDANDAEEVKTAWSRIADHMHDLFTDPEDIAPLRQTITQLAVKGRLVAQVDTDEPAMTLVERIREERAQREKGGRRRAINGAQPPIQDPPFEVPLGWEWVSLAELATVRGGKRLPKGHTYSERATPHVYIQVTNMKNGTIVPEPRKYISAETHSVIAQYIIKSTDIYITIAGTIGQTGLVPDAFDGMNLTENAARISAPDVNREYLQKCTMSPLVQRHFAEQTNQQAQPKLALKRILTAPVPLPPLNEQQRIVTKVNEMMTLLDHLEATLRTCQESQEAFCASAVRVLPNAGSEPVEEGALAVR